MTAERPISDADKSTTDKHDSRFNPGAAFAEKNQSAGFTAASVQPHKGLPLSPAPPDEYSLTRPKPRARALEPGQSILLIITIVLMNFDIGFPSVALPSHLLFALLRSTDTMKRPLLLGLTLSLFAINAFAQPADEEPTPMVQPASSTLTQPLDPVAEDGAQRTLNQQNRVAEDGAQRTLNQQNRVAEDGAQRTLNQQNRVAEDGYDRTQKQLNRVAEGGADRLAERNQRAS